MPPPSELPSQMCHVCATEDHETPSELPLLLNSFCMFGQCMPAHPSIASTKVHKPSLLDPKNSQHTVATRALFTPSPSARHRGDFVFRSHRHVAALRAAPPRAAAACDDAPPLDEPVPGAQPGRGCSAESRVEGGFPPSLPGSVERPSVHSQKIPEEVLKVRSLFWIQPIRPEALQSRHFGELFLISPHQSRILVLN